MSIDVIYLLETLHLEEEADFVFRYTDGIEGMDRQVCWLKSYLDINTHNAKLGKPWITGSG